MVGLPEMIGAESLAGRERFRVDLLAHARAPATLGPTDWGLIDQDELERADVRFGTELIAFDAETDGVTEIRCWAGTT